ncbi:MAG TPA: addiction module antidote protein [Bdellovibrio sp.]
MAKGSAFQEHLKFELLDPEFAASYLAVALEQGDEQFLYEALAEIVKVHGFSKVSAQTGIARQAIYKMLSSDGNPSFKNVAKLLSAIGLELAINPKKVG